MHISDGILSFELSMVLNCGAAAGVLWSGRRIRVEQIPAAGIMTAMIFVMSSIHIPLGIFSFHLTFAGLAGLLLGSGSITVMFISLLFQALFLQHGGVVSIGANLFIMGSGCFVGMLCRKWVSGIKLKGLVSGSGGVVVPVCVLGVLFELSGYGKGFLYMLGIYIIPAITEGMLVSMIMVFLKKSAPELVR